jgi:PBP1b-binding outer membrane lipoprotein LpoB
MKRVLAIALIGGALLLGGCGRQATASTGNAPTAATTTAPATKSDATKSATGNAGTTAASSTDDQDVDSLLNDVDKQLSSDDQPPADQD